MIIKKLRQQQGWSQEQLAQMCGLSTRTIQRIESGNKASLESLKSLAAVFKIDIAKLTGEIVVMNKTTERWKQLPWFLRFNLIGIERRRDILILEIFCFILGLGFSIASYWQPQLSLFAPFIFSCAYASTWLLRAGDKHHIW